MLAGCGGGSEKAASVPAGQNDLDAEFVSKADAICRKAVTDTEAVGRRFHSVPPATSDPVALTNKGLVAPALAILQRESAALRALQPSAGSAGPDAFIGLFEPIVELTRQRLAMRDASQGGEAHHLELLIIGLLDEQQLAARALGLHACGTNFFRTLVSPPAQ